MGDPDGEFPAAASAGVAPIDAALRDCLPGLRTLLRRLTGNVDTAHDLAQEVLVIAWKALKEGKLRDPSALRAYVHQCARNMASAHGKKRSPVSLEELPAHMREWISEAPTPFDLIEQSDMKRMAQQAIADLPTERDRELILGFYVEGKSKLELMQAYALDRDPFDKVMSRARKRMVELVARCLRGTATEKGNGSAT
jgi:RNA polymerase sigma factor (sigma-70 family)